MSDGTIMGRLPGGRLDQLPREVIAWVCAQAAVSALCAVAGLWADAPAAAMALSLSAGVVAARPQRWWAAPVVLAAALAVSLGLHDLQWPSIIGVGAVVGIAAIHMLPGPHHALDTLNGALAGIVFAGLGLLVSDALSPAGIQGVSAPSAALLQGGVAGLISAGTLLPRALRFEVRGIPSTRAVERTLEPQFRRPVVQAAQIVASARQHSLDNTTRAGLEEVVRWVFSLQETRQTLSHEAQRIDVADVNTRLQAAESTEADASDTFMKERQRATAAHLKRILHHRERMVDEERRNGALVDYALAFLEEARSGLTLSQQLPGEASPDQLPEVLDRLRTQAADGSARRKTAREVHRLPS